MEMRLNIWGRRRVGALAVIGSVLIGTAPALAGPCRVTDFTDRSRYSLNEVESLSFAVQMTRSG